MISKSRNKSQGFTLIEMMITLAVGAILMTIAVPSFVDMTKNNKITSQANILMTQIHFARAEASKRSTRVTLCRSADPTAASPTCGGTAQTWSNGWLVYALGDTSGRTAPFLYDKTKDTLLLVSEGRGGVTIKTDNNADDILEFKSDGSTVVSNTSYFAFCDDRGISHGKEIEVLPTGRAQVISAATCTP